ncbi:hypothetical protein BI081_gp230 [Mycobacterium phage Tonenili]|uniref:Minor tail protein n=1 Tax=Mycobacterium phage Tonenili TaxID=1891703 RepID=A0A1C9EHB0_9CAUD|nr:hypothetical protein BI081_gp230 [Mycobacterium phage Tonenili]AON96877.1 hypothetical protein SEA_TONENILI_130 [Mycobacterium phage Tonenili]
MTTRASASRLSVTHAPVNPEDVANKGYVDSAIAAVLANDGITMSAIDGLEEALNTKMDKSLVDAKGDLVIGTANNSPGILPVGADRTFLTPKAANATGLEWTTIQASDISGLTELLALRAPINNPTFTGTVSGITKAMVGLGNVDNTSDATKNSAAVTLTNKRITKRVQDQNGPGVTPTLAWDSYDMIILRNIGAAITSLSSGITGTPTQGQPWLLRFKDNGTARALTWGAAYRAIGVTLPTTTVANKTLYVGGFYNATDAVYDVTAVGQEA